MKKGIAAKTSSASCELSRGPRLFARIQVIEIVNHGFADFGLVAAQYTRRGHNQNWYHHVVFYDGLFIYDFDFGQKPEPVSPREYIARNFVTERMHRSPGTCQRDLGQYRFSFYAAKV